MDSFEVIFLLLAFAGGIIGVAIGGLNIFILCGLSCIVGTTYFIATGDTRINDYITWGPLLGPQVAFAGAVAGSGYAFKLKKLESGRDIAISLFGKSDLRVLLIGGTFGLLGQGIKMLLDLAPMVNGWPAFNSIALSLIITGIIARLIFGSSGVFGKVKPGDSRWKSLDENDIWSQPAFKTIVLGAAFGLPVAFINLNIPESTGLIFGFAAASLLFIQLGKQIPVTHHIVLAAEFGTLATGSLWWGAFFAVFSAVLGELFAGIFLIHGDTHIDPPAAALIIIFSLIPILTLTGMFGISSILPIAAIVILCSGGYLMLNRLKTSKN